MNNPEHIAVGDTEISKTFTPREIWNTLCEVIRISDDEAVDGILTFCEELLNIPSQQIENQLYIDGVISDSHFRNYTEDDL